MTNLEELKKAIVEAIAGYNQEKRILAVALSNVLFASSNNGREKMSEIQYRLERIDEKIRELVTSIASSVPTSEGL